MEQHWEKEARESKERKELQEKYPLLGKKVRRKGIRKWEEGVIVLDKGDWSSIEELFIKFAEDDFEQLIGLPFEIYDEELKKWIKG